jgi:radical SAM protein with 4Fe4S-binding SPASM domain
MVRLAKDAGCMVGTSTSGVLLDGKTIEQIVESGMDIVAFSLAGIDDGNDMIRKGTRFKTVMEAIKFINREKAKAKTTLPSINVAYMLLRSKMDKLSRLPQAFSRQGINQVVISTLDFIPDRKFLSESILPDNDEEYEQLRVQLDNTIEKGRSAGLDIHYNLYNPSRRRKVCTENVQYSLFVSSDGTVSPCVFTNLPIKESSLQNDKMFPSYRRLTMGNINENTLSRIWNQQDYKNFRESFNTDRLPETCVKCPKLNIT